MTNHSTKTLLHLTYGLVRSKTLLLLSLYHLTCFAQDRSEILNWFDLITGEELFISSDIKTIDGYPVMRGQHPFFPDDKFYRSKIKYNNQDFYELITYNIYKDELVLYTPNEENTQVKLVNNKVTSFSLANKWFVNLAKYGFSEVLSQSSESALYVKHTKKMINRRRGIVAFEKKESFFLFHNNTYRDIKSKTDWIKAFPSKKNKIEFYYSKHGDILDESPTNFAKNLFNHLTKEAK